MSLVTNEVSYEEIVISLEIELYTFFVLTNFWQKMIIESGIIFFELFDLVE